MIKVYDFIYGRIKFKMILLEPSIGAQPKVKYIRLIFYQLELRCYFLILTISFI